MEILNKLSDVKEEVILERLLQLQAFHLREVEIISNFTTYQLPSGPPQFSGWVCEEKDEMFRVNNYFAIWTNSLDPRPLENSLNQAYRGLLTRCVSTIATIVHSLSGSRCIVERRSHALFVVGGLNDSERHWVSELSPGSSPSPDLEGKHLAVVVSRVNDILRGINLEMRLQKFCASKRREGGEGEWPRS